MLSIITAMYLKGYNANYISKYLNLPLKKVYNKLVEKNVVPIAQLENRNLDDDDIIAIYETYNKGTSLYKVAQDFDTNKIVITDILNRRSYKNVSDRYGLEVTKCYNRNNTFEYSVAAIVLAANDGYPIMDIALIFDLPRPTVGNILKSYDIKAVDARRFIKSGRKLTEEEVLVVFNLRREGRSMQEIANVFGVSRQLINNLLSGKVYADVCEKYNLI